MAMKSLTYILLASLLYLSAGVSVLFFTGLRHQRRVIRSSLYSRRNIRTLKFTSGQDIEWTLEGREFVVDGQMYDVVEIATDQEGNIIIRCIVDKEETNLRHQFGKLFTHSTENNFALQYLQNLLSVKYTGASAFTLQVHRIAATIDIFALFNLPAGYKASIDHPPQIVG